jgi:hypothetical protein
MISFNHFNFNILNLEKSLAFYKEALGLTPVREKEASDGSFKLVYLGDGKSDFTLELTYLADRKEPYDLGECEFHLPRMSLTRFMRNTKKWALSALKIREWGSILSVIRMDTGLRLFRRGDKRSAFSDVLPYRKRRGTDGTTCQWSQIILPRFGPWSGRNPRSWEWGRPFCF